MAVCTRSAYCDSATEGLHSTACSQDNNLQDPSNKRKILPDDKLRTLFTFPLNMFSINKQISKHCKPAKHVYGHEEELEKPAKKAKTAKASKESKEAENGEAAGGKKKKGGFMVPQKLSPEMSALLGIDAATRGECQKRLVQYAKVRCYAALLLHDTTVATSLCACLRWPLAIGRSKAL